MCVNVYLYIYLYIYTYIYIDPLFGHPLIRQNIFATRRKVVCRFVGKLIYFYLCLCGLGNGFKVNKQHRTSNNVISAIVFDSTMILLCNVNRNREREREGERERERERGRENEKIWFSLSNYWLHYIRVAFIVMPYCGDGSFLPIWRMAPMVWFGWARMSLQKDNIFDKCFDWIEWF